MALLTAAGLAACSRPTPLFSDQNARVHVATLAGTIGSRPVGTPANARARVYIIEQLTLFGFTVRVQEADARRAEIGRTARVSNIIGILPGSRSEAIGLVSHYDSAPESPGATDDGLGVAVTLEAARVLAARPRRAWTLMVLVTDGEEAGLMGAAALMTDREVTARLRAYVNVESIGSAGTALLFETGPGNGWLVTPWARHAPYPRGASFGVEIYRRLPNDTDFSIIKRQEIPGLNFAPVGDSYAYHTARDTPERLSLQTIRDTGQNVVAVAAALDNSDITRRSNVNPTYFDVGGTTAVSYGPVTEALAAAAALLLGVIAWVRLTAAAIRIGGLGRWLLTIVWSAVGSVAIVLSMVGATWALRAAREVNHPWYARPDRLFVLLLSVGVTVGWSVTRAGYWLPKRAHGPRHPIVTWSVTLPIWIALASASVWWSPAAAYLWVLPLLTAGALLTIVPVASGPAVRAASVVILAVAATLWMRDTIELLRFTVAVFGRLPFVTPPFVYAVFVAIAGVMIAPPFIAVTVATRPLLRPSLMTAVCLLVLAIAAGLAYVAPAYTFEQPLRRSVRALQDGVAGSAIWEVGSAEPGLDLAATAPTGWSLESNAPSGSVPWGRLPYPFVFRTAGPSLGPPPIEVVDFIVRPVAGGIDVSLTVVPRQPGLAVSFVLPPGIAPARHSFPGVVRSGRWTATYVAPPADGLAFRASFAGVDADRLRDMRVTATAFRFPGGQGWQSLPDWLPQDRAVWNATATWSVPVGVTPTIAAVAALR